MFESYIASLLDGYIGQYVEGFDLKQFGLRDTILRDLTIRSDAFSGLDIAVKVRMLLLSYIEMGKKFRYI
jgi:hypothetical protein